MSAEDENSRWFSCLSEKLKDLVNIKIDEGFSVSIRVKGCYHSFDYPNYYNPSIGGWSQFYVGRISYVTFDEAIRPAVKRLLDGSKVSIIISIKEPCKQVSTIELNALDHPIFQEIDDYLSSIEDLLIADPSEYVDKISTYMWHIKTENPDIVKKSAGLRNAFDLKMKDMLYLRDMILKTFGNVKHYKENVLPLDNKRFEDLQEKYSIS
jgi:hypothetical protein